MKIYPMITKFYRIVSEDNGFGFMDDQGEIIAVGDQFIKTANESILDLVEAELLRISKIDWVDCGQCNGLEEFAAGDVLQAIIFCRIDGFVVDTINKTLEEIF